MCSAGNARSDNALAAFPALRRTLGTYRRFVPVSGLPTNTSKWMADDSLAILRDNFGGFGVIEQPVRDASKRARRGNAFP
jgi:hypothetical protein